MPGRNGGTLVRHLKRVTGVHRGPDLVAIRRNVARGIPLQPTPASGRRRPVRSVGAA